MKRFVIVLLLAIMLLAPGSASLTLDTLFGDPPREGEPILSIQKWATVDEVKLGDNVTVHVNITNYSDADAYNLTVIEPIFNNWSRTDFVDYERYEYTRLGSNASISYQYSITLAKAGNYTIEPTVIDYVNVNGSQYHAKSSYLPLLVYEETKPVDLSAEWRTIFFWCLGFIFFPTIVLIIYRYRK